MILSQFLLVILFLLTTVNEVVFRVSQRSTANREKTFETRAQQQTAYVIRPYNRSHKIAGSDPNADRRDPEACLEEACGLARAIDLNVVGADVAAIVRPRPSTLFGEGKVSEVSDRLDAFDQRPDLVVVDGALSPIQHRNLEKIWNCKVLDRTALILEIFGARASTAEGRIQVELAHLTYQRSRLVRSWTHLERQRGGAGFLGGPGERQIESDRRALAVKIDRLKHRLEQVRRTRSLQRAKRKRAPQAVIALVGYTNAGKSTLFNRVTRSDVKAQDLLFATLDPTMRAVELPAGETIILSDTVGFISELPTQLIAAFRATLEEVCEADVIVHVRDISHPDTDAQRDDVLKVLATLGVGVEHIKEPQDNQSEIHPPVIEVLNKIDLLEVEDRLTIEAVAMQNATVFKDESDTIPTLEAPLQVCLSAETGEGVSQLIDHINTLITKARLCYAVSVGAADGAARAWLYEHGDVEKVISGNVDQMQKENDQDIFIVRLDDKNFGQLTKKFPSLNIAIHTAMIREQQIA
ncbi:MAG: GTPase HflX [Pseudomonadota bacterium]